MRFERGSGLSINVAALMLSLMNAGLAAFRPLMLATILSAGAVRTNPNFAESTTRHIASILSVEYVTAALVLLATLEMAAFVSGFLTDFLVLVSGTRKGRKLRAALACRVLQAMGSRRNEERANSYVSRVRADMDVIEQYHRVSLIPSFGALLQIVFSLILAAMLSPMLAAVLILEIAITLSLVWLYSNLHARLSLDRLIAEEGLGKGAQLHMRAALTIWFGRTGSLWLRHRLADARTLARARVRYGLGTVVYHNAVSFSLAILIVIGGFLTFRSADSAAAQENFFVLVLYSGFLLGPVIRLTSFIPETREYRTSMTRVLARHKDATPSPFEPVPTELKQISIQWQRGVSEQAFVSTTLPIEGIFRKGEKVAIIGQSGSGKTTLFELVLGARESPSARILVNGQDAAELFRLMPALGAVYLTDTAFFESGTIEQNDINKSPDAIRLMRVVRLIEEDRDAVIFLERAIDRNGEPLSLGERQRVQLVRALLTRPKLLLMDEALSGVAEEAEIRIVKWLIGEKLRDAIVLYASHRPAIQALFPTRIYLDENVLAR